MRVVGSEKFPIKIWATDLETEAENQVKRIANLPFIHSHVSVMPDAHHGKGSTVGTVIATRGTIIPAAVGVDIGCGMRALKLPFKIDVFGDSIEKLRLSIERSVPVGFHQNKKVENTTEKAFKSIFENNVTTASKELLEKAFFQLGSLGGGNHFIEICHDENNDAWIVLHTGSRNIGKSLAEIHINKAKGIMKSYFIDLPDPDLAYFAKKTPEFREYLEDLFFCQNYAYRNREEIMMRVVRDVCCFLSLDKMDFDLMIDCHHNYTSLENHFGENVFITRKGAVSAKKGELGIIPGSMGTKSYIVRGLGNLQSFCSCSHGAGRKLSRNKARELFTIEDLKLQTKGVSCSIREEVIDEIPSAYKDIDQVMENQKDLVEIIHELKQIMCIKG